MTAPDPKAADAVRAAANAAGAVDDDAVVALVNQATERLGGRFSEQTAAAQVASIKANKPALFMKNARDMTEAEYSAAKAGMVRDERARKRAGDQARELERISKRYQK